MTKDVVGLVLMLGPVLVGAAVRMLRYSGAKGDATRDVAPH